MQKENGSGREGSISVSAGRSGVRTSRMEGVVARTIVESVGVGAYEGRMIR